MTKELVLSVLACVAIGYLIGCISPAFFAGKRRGYDVRETGSKNAGASNVLIMAGKFAGAIVALLDIFKAFGSWKLAEAIFPELPAAGMIAGASCVFGHMYPVFLGFRGGKGVSSGAMIALVIDWRVFLCVLGAFFVAALLSKKVSLGSICGALTIFIASLTFHVSVPRLVLAGVAMLLVVVRHRENILRIVRGTEPDFKPGKSLRRGKDEC